MILVKFLQNKLRTVPPDKWQDVFIAYDNMCNVDRMRVAKQELDLPPPYNKMWMTVSKIIDSFHLKNHKRKEGHEVYNPKKLKDIHPTFNTQTCEQTFSWLGRFHRILSSMPKVHNHFFVHRLVKRRNEYNSHCYFVGKKPLLPNVKHNNSN